MIDAVADALARNDRYLHEFVEKLDICPFARPCRETGALERRVFLQESLDHAPPLAMLRDLTSEAFAHVEIGLAIFPRIEADFWAFERFAAELRDVRAKGESGVSFYVVPFHPDSPPDTEDPHRLVSLLRRSPDPTLQLVRASLLERVRGRNTEDTVWVDPATIDLDNPPRPSPPSMSTRIAEVNWEKVQKVGAHSLVGLLASMRQR